MISAVSQDLFSLLVYLVDALPGGIRLVEED